MEHGEASKLALYGVADYNWNVSAYNAIDNWERSLVDGLPRHTRLTVHLPYTRAIPRLAIAA